MQHASLAPPNLSPRSILDTDMSRILIIFFLLTLLASCTRYFEYHFISLEETPGIKISEFGKSSYPGLRGDDAFPKEYLLNRDGYSLEFRILETAFSPHLQISIQGNTTGLSLEPQERINAISTQSIKCANSYMDEADTTSFFFRWEDDCFFERIPKYISFDVMGDNGIAIAKEDLQFKIKKNGWFLVIDGP